MHIGIFNSHFTADLVLSLPVKQFFFEILTHLAKIQAVNRHCLALRVKNSPETLCMMGQILLTNVATLVVPLILTLVSTNVQLL